MPRMTSTKAFLLSHQGQKTDRPRILTVPVYTAHVSATCSVELLRQELWVLMMHLSCTGACRTHQTRFHPITRASLPFRLHSSSPSQHGVTPLLVGRKHNTSATLLMLHHLMPTHHTTHSGVTRPPYHTNQAVQAGWHTQYHLKR
jgi:hypothetical protein